MPKPLDALFSAAAEVDERVRTAHERVACPKCSAPVGVRCCRMPRGYRRDPDRLVVMKYMTSG